MLKTKAGNYFRVMRETCAAYDPDFNTVRILSEFTPREKFLSLAHEYVHFFIWQLPESCVTKIDKWHDRLSEFAQWAPALSLPTALERQKRILKSARRVPKSEIDRILRSQR
jgi:hypothetical protein